MTDTARLVQARMAQSPQPVRPSPRASRKGSATSFPEAPSQADFYSQLPDGDAAPAAAAAPASASAGEGGSEDTVEAIVAATMSSGTLMYKVSTTVTGAVCVCVCARERSSER